MKTVLLIEDNTDIRENTCELLELEGYNVVAADSGETGLFLARENKPDIILCDIMMSGMNGYEVFAELKNDGTTSVIPLVFISASVERKAIDNGLAMGAKAYIQKPFDSRELFDVLINCLKEG